MEYSDDKTIPLRFKTGMNQHGMHLCPVLELALEQTLDEYVFDRIRLSLQEDEVIAEGDEGPDALLEDDRQRLNAGE